MSTKPSHILGMNARYKLTSLNSGASKKYGFSKLRTKALMKEHSIATAEIYHTFDAMEDLDQINWHTVPAPFVIKPASGSAGKGVWVIKKKDTVKLTWQDSDGNTVTEDDLTLHVRNILDGEYSTWGSEHKAIVEEMITADPRIARHAYRGTPDIRVIIFNSVPVMAMIRLPTKESHGRANLDQGAVGLGIDLATGVTTYGVQGKAKQIYFLPSSSKRKVNGIMIPYWKQTLITAVKAANAAGYIFMGADLFIHETKGPMIVELNGFPGLSIQLANRAGLKRRIERVEDLDVRDAEHGVKIAQALFAEHFSDKLMAEEGLQIIPVNPTALVYGSEKQSMTITSLINTSRFRSMISEKLAQELGLVDLDDLLWQQQEGLEGKLPVIEVKLKIKNRLFKTAMVVGKRLDRTRHKIELGKNDLSGFLIGEVDS